MRTRIAVAAAALALVLSPAARVEAGVIFSDNFEGTLAQWVGQGGGAHHGLIIPDALNPGNNVLSFIALNAGGDIFATAAGFVVAPGQNLWLTFDYRTPGTSSDGGGFAGLSNGFPGAHVWYAGTQDTYPGLSQVLIDDGQWHSYAIAIASPFGLVHVMLEEFSGSDSQIGNALFDNVQLWDSPPGSVPAPPALVLLGIGLVARTIRRRT
jgi:hypothetical protein